MSILEIFSPPRERRLINRINEAKRQGLPLVVLFGPDSSFDIIVPFARYGNVIYYKDPGTGYTRFVVVKKVYRMGNIPVVVAIDPLTVSVTDNVLTTLLRANGPLRRDLRQAILITLEKIKNQVKDEQDRQAITQLEQGIVAEDTEAYKTALTFLKKLGIDASLEPDMEALRGILDVIPSKADVRAVRMASWEKTGGRLLVAHGAEEVTTSGWDKLLKMLLPILLLLFILGLMVWGMGHMSAPLPGVTVP